MKKDKPLDPLLVTPANIPSFAQNRVRLIVDDLAKLGISPQDVQRVLMARGVNKWFEARRAVIRLKHSLKTQVTETIEYIIETKQQKARPGKFGTTRRDCLNRLYYARGYLKATEEIRARLRAICHMHRWQAPEPNALQMLPSTGVRQLAKIHELQGELKDADRALELAQGENQRLESDLEVAVEQARSASAQAALLQEKVRVLKRDIKELRDA